MMSAPASACAGVAAVSTHVAVAAHGLHDFRGHCERRRRDQRELQAAVQREQLDERVHGAPVLQVADHRDVRAVDQLAQARELALDGVQVEQRLAGVLARAIAAVDDRHVGGAREFGDRALLRMPHHDRIGIAADDAAGVVDRFALGHRRKGEARGVAHRAAQPAERRAEAHAGARAGFEEQIGQHGPFEHAADLASARDGLHHVGQLEQFVDGVAVELADRQQVVRAFSGQRLAQGTFMCALRIFYCAARLKPEFRSRSAVRLRAWP